MEREKKYLSKPKDISDANLKREGSPETIILDGMHALVNRFRKTVSGTNYGIEDEQFHEKMEDFRAQCEQDFPDRMEEISAIFDLPQFLLDQSALESSQFDSPEKKGAYIQKLTEYQYLITDFIARNQDKREYLQEFWGYFGKIAYAYGIKPYQVESLRTGILGQVATKNLFESSGIATRQATPHEDAFYKLDFWMEDADDKKAIQIKTSQKVEKLEIVGEQDKIVLPAFVWPEDNEDRIFFTNLVKQMKSFRIKTAQYGEATGQQVKAYMIILPRHEIDGITGLPSASLIGDFKSKIVELVSSEKKKHKKEETKRHNQLSSANLEIRPGENKQKAKSRHSYEMMDKIKDEFDPLIQEYLIRYLKGENLSPNEKLMLGDARSTWWKKEFGSRFDQWNGKEIFGNRRIKRIKRRKH